MKLVEMKRTPAELKAREESYKTASPMSGDSYGYGLRLCLDEESLKKLGIKPSSFDVGDVVTIEAKAKVVELSQNASQSRTNSRVELQITKLGVSKGATTMADAVREATK